MIRVCLVSPYSYKLFHPENESLPSFGGAEVQQYLLGKELAKDEDFKVSFLVGNFYTSQPKNEETQFDDHTVNLYKTVNCGKRNFFLDFFLDFWFLYSKMKQTSADIFIIRGGGSLAGKTAIVSKFILRKKFIYSSAHDRESDGSFSKKHSRFVNMIFMRALNNSDAVICQHQNQYKAFKNNFNINTIVLKTMYPLNTDRAQLALVTRNYILWVGRFVDFKQPELFIDLAKHFPEEKFLIITNSNKTDVEETIQKHTNIKIIKNVPFEQMDGYFEKAKIFVNTSTQEGFPNTFVQAAKNGVPIYSLNVNPSDMLKRYGMGYCANGITENLVNSLKAILHNFAEWQRMSQEALAYAKENHNIESVIKEYKILFKTLST